MFSSGMHVEKGALSRFFKKSVPGRKICKMEKKSPDRRYTAAREHHPYIFLDNSRIEKIHKLLNVSSSRNVHLMLSTRMSEGCNTLQMQIAAACEAVLSRRTVWADPAAAEVYRVPSGRLGMGLHCKSSFKPTSGSTRAGSVGSTVEPSYGQAPCGRARQSAMVCDGLPSQQLSFDPQIRAMNFRNLLEIRRMS